MNSFWNDWHRVEEINERLSGDESDALARMTARAVLYATLAAFGSGMILAIAICIFIA